MQNKILKLNIKEVLRSVAIIKPNKKQIELLTCPADLILFGGSRGGSKTFGILLDFINHKSKYGVVHGMLIRTTKEEMAEIEYKSLPIYTAAGFSWNISKKIYTHTDGSTLKFENLANDKDASSLQGTSKGWIGLDEIGTWSGEIEHGKPVCDRFRKILGCLRTSNPKEKVRVVASCNPGGIGQEWIKHTWHLTDKNNVPIHKLIKEDGFIKTYIPSRISDNPDLLKSDPNYINRLKAVGGRSRQAAWIDGDFWTNPDSNFFKGADFKYFVKDPTTGLPIFEQDEKIVLSYQSWDTAFSIKQANDYSVGYMFIKTNLNLYVIDMIRDKLEFPGLKKAVINFQSRYNADLVEVENKASGISLVQELKAITGIAIKARNIKGDLKERGEVCKPLIEAGKIKLPSGAVWLDEFFEEITNFPTAAHDDIVSALLLGIEKYKESNSVNQWLDDMEKIKGRKY